MVPFFLNTLGFTMELRSPSNFKMTGLVQPWQTLGKIFARCLTKRVTGHDQPPLQIIAHDKYHNLEDDEMVKNIFNSGKHKNDVGMKIPSWMIMDEMKLTDHYRMYVAENQVLHKSLLLLLIRLRIPQRRSTRLTPPTPIPTTAEADDIILQDTIQLSLAEQKSCDELEAKQNVQKFEEHLIAKEIEKLVKGVENVENVEVNSSTLRQNDNPIDPDTRLEPMSDKEIEKKEKGKHVEESRNTPSPTTTISLRIHSTLISLDTEKLQELTETDLKPSSSTLSSSSPKSNITAINRLLSLFKFMPIKKFNVLAQHLQEIMEELLPTMVDDRVKELTKTQVLDDPYDDAHPEGENKAKRQKTSEHGTFVFGESSSGQDFESEPDDDEIPTKKVLQELVDEMSHTIDEAKLRKVEIIKEILVLPHLQRPIPVIQSCQRDPKAPALSLVNQDLLKNVKMDRQFITEIVARRANGSIASITKSDYKYLNKNDIEDMYLIIVNNKVDDYAETGIKKCKVFSIISELVYGIIYKNNKKEKRVMRHQEVHKFCDATLKRILEGLKSYNNDVKHGYVTPSLSNEDAEYLQLFEEEIEERLKHRDQMRHWEMYVN
ncbi:hypothetical protein Tco_1226817 [Tanacetum coccineum]